MGSDPIKKFKFERVTMMGLLSMWIESLDYEYEVLKTCTHHQSPRSKCKKCVDACEMNAITMIKGIPTIAKSDCTQCGKCIASCSVQAIAGIFPKRAVIHQHLVVAKQEQAPTMKELLVYYKKGIKKIASEEEIPEDWAASIDEANKALEQLNENPIDIVREKVERGTEPISRRDLFFSWQKDAQGLMKQMAPAKWRFNQEDLNLAKYYPNHQFAEIVLDSSKCTLCKACEVLCSKNCLKITDNDFNMIAQSCSACGLCQDICPEQAITVEEKIVPNKIEQVPVFKKICTQCNQSYHTLFENDDKCVHCKKREGFLSYFS